MCWNEPCGAIALPMEARPFHTEGPTTENDCWKLIKRHPHERLVGLLSEPHPGFLKTLAMSYIVS